MCGIAGVLNFDGAPVDPRVLKRMTDAIAHRGPDGEGWYMDKGVGLGHRRLAILDLSPAGQQPMITDDGRYVLTYNGEVYNFRELRVELENLGYKFKSSTDSEVVLNAWHAWGAEAVPKFNGMFAFAIWDSRERVVSLVRDRYGIKPLYWQGTNDYVAFASEQRGIHAGIPKKKLLDEEALIEYFTFQNIFTDRTLTKDIRIVPPGTILSIHSSGQQSSRKYWDYHFTEPAENVDDNEYKEESKRLLVQAVKRQLVSDVPIGSYLSGGIDSGTITALSTKSLRHLRTFTCGFDLSSATGAELRYDERVRAEAISSLFKTEHYEIVLNSSDMERCLDDVVTHIEEPRVGQSYPNFLVARLASKFVKVVMSGAGGDELFGGYPWRYYRASSSSTFDTFIDEYYQYWHRLVSNQQLRRLFAPIWRRVSHVWTKDIFREVFLKHENKLETHEDYINHCLYFEARTFLHGLLVVEDKLSMANGLETRVPLLDNDLVDFAMRCPVRLKVKDLRSNLRLDENVFGNKRETYFFQSKEGKSILRDVMGQIVPDFDTKAAKQGFSSPDSSWFRGESSNFVAERLLNPQSPIYEFLDFREAAALLSEHQSARINRRLLVWSLLSFDSLLRNW
jgi:asparagine synthase (glutamine-hydrolysing)